MPKIRTLKASFFRDEDLSCGLIVKMLAAGLICCMADDEGRFKAGVGQIRGEVFTHDKVTDEEVGEALNILDSVGFIQLYSVDKRPVGAIVNWKLHQPVPPSRFEPSRLPPAPTQARRKHRASTAQARRSPRARPEVEREREVEREVESARRRTPFMENMLLAWLELTGRPATAKDEESASRAEVICQKVPWAKTEKFLADVVEHFLSQNKQLPTLAYCLPGLAQLASSEVDGSRPVGHTFSKPNFHAVLEAS